MINEHDVEDWKDAKYQQPPKATNHKGWVVQQYEQGRGWKTVDGPFELKATAETVVRLYVGVNIEYRVYEALEKK